MEHWHHCVPVSSGQGTLPSPDTSTTQEFLRTKYHLDASVSMSMLHRYSLFYVHITTTTPTSTTHSTASTTILTATTTTSLEGC